VSTPSLTFTSANWNVAQVVTVTGVDDFVQDGNIAYSIITAAATSGDGNYNGLNAADVAVTNIDNDTAGITVSAISGNTTEAGGTATFTVILDSQPMADVIIGISSNDLTEGTVSTPSLTFTSANWNVAQVVTVTGVDDFVQDGNIAYSIITTAATSGDGNYNGLNAADVAVTNIDNDTAGITVSAISGNTTEAGGTATFTVVLDSQPTANVVIGISSSDLTEGTVLTSSLTFTSANWNVAQVVTVTGVDDFVQDGNIPYSIVTAAATSGDGNYNGVDAADVAVTNVDNDVFNTIVVDTTSDIADGDTSSISALMANRGVDGFISLREAMLAANNTANGATPDLINFNIAGVGPHIIQPLSALPAITDAIILDGTSEPDFAGTPVVVIDGSLAGASASGLQQLIGSDGSTIRGLVIKHFTNVGVDIASSGNRVEGNVIAFNGGAGVSLQAGTGNRVLGNSIHTNTGLGIDLGAAGVTANDLGDVDTGANNLQNFPALVSAASSGGNTTILGTLNSTASTTFDLHFYSSPLADASGFGEGQVYLATASVTTDGSGNAPINTTLIGVSVTTGQVIAATATDPTGNTSEFSIAVTVASPNPILDLDANNSSGQSGADFAVAWTEDGPPVNIADADATLFDADSTTLTSLTVTITNLLDGAAEMLSANTGGTSISANYDSMTGVLSLTGVDTVANYQQVLRSVTYDNMRQDPDTTARVITFVANDGTNASNLGTTTITLNETNDDPTNAGTLPTDVAVTEDVTSNVDLSAIDLSDVDAGAGSLTVTLSTAAGGNLSAASSGGVTVGGSGTSVLTLDGTLANLNTFLNTASNITYLHGTPDTNGNNADTIQVSVADNGNTGTGGGSTVTLGTVNVDIGTVNDAPVNTVPGTQTVAEDTPTIISGISAADLDAASGNITTRLQVTNGRLDVALFGAATISSGASGTNDLTIQGSVTDVNGTLAALRYTGSLHVFGVAADSLTVTTNDQGNTGSGGALQDVDNIQIDIAAVNDAPVVTGPVSALSAVEQIGLAIAGTGFSVSDVDETGSGASATLSVGEGGITIAQGNSGVVISSGNGTGTVTLTGTIAQIDNLLTGTSTGSITYLNASDTPLPSTLLNITVSDQGNTGSGGPQATSAIAVINIAAVNDAPQIDLDANNSSGQLGANFANTFIEDAGPVRVADADATLTDVDSATLVSLQVVLINQFDGANEVLAANTTGTSITANYTAGVLTLSGVDSIANYQQVLRTVTYQNASQNPNTTARIIEFVANDGTLSSNLATATVNIVRQNDAPVSFPESYSVDNNKTLSIVVPGLLANDSDVDSDPLTVTLVSGPATGTLTLDANGSFTYVPNLNFSGTTSFTYVATDGTLSSAPTTVSIEVVAVAAAPIVPNPNPTPTPAPGPPPTQDPGDSEPNDSSPPAGTPVSPNDPDAENNEHGPAVGSGAPGTTNDDSKLKIAPAETTFALAETDDGAAQRVIAEVIRAGSARVGSASGSLRPDGLGAQRFGSVDLAAPVVDFDLTELQRGVLWQQLDTLHQQIETSSDRIDHIAGTATVVTAALSTGYVIWALRGSFLVASFLSTIPTWRSLDPLPIIEGNRRAGGEDDDDESLADIAQSRSRKDSESSSASASGRG
jgi:parallel beta-helix repeat protein